MELRSVPYSQFRSIRVCILDRLPASCNNGFHDLGLENLTAISFVLGVRTSKRDLVLTAQQQKEKDEVERLLQKEKHGLWLWRRNGCFSERGSDIEYFAEVDVVGEIANSRK